MNKVWIFIIITAIMSGSCTQSVEKQQGYSDFGIYGIRIPLASDSSLIHQIIAQYEVPVDHNILGYSLKNTDSYFDSLQALGKAYGIHLAVTERPWDGSKRYYGVMALKDSGALKASDIKRAISKTDHVEIHFNMAGAKKWANLTAENTGKQIAFCLNNRILCTPYIQTSIRTGIAMITGLNHQESDSIANVLDP